MKKYSFEFENGIVQILNLITKLQYDDYKQFVLRLTEHETDLKNKKFSKSLVEKSKILQQISLLKDLINLNFGDNFFVEGSPMYNAITTGYIDLPYYQGGKHKVIVKRIYK